MKINSTIENGPCGISLQKGGDTNYVCINMAFGLPRYQKLKDVIETLKVEDILLDAEHISWLFKTVTRLELDY